MTLPRSYFDALYESAEDPWSFMTRRYEARKRALTLAALPDDRYGSVFEPGCSIGVLTEALSTRADLVVAMDVAVASLEVARRRGLEGVRFVQGAVPADWPGGSFDLVVISEIGYYLDRRDCRQLAELAFGSGRDVLAVHWRHPVVDYPLGGDDVHAVFAEVAGSRNVTRLVGHVEEDLLLDVWSSDGRSVARRSGLIR